MSEIAGHPTVSVLLPVHNAERYVAETIRSVLTQSFVDFELLIADDGSTDRSAEVIQREVAGDPRVIFIRQPNVGFAVTLNRLIERSRGQYIARIDADDVAMPDRFTKQLIFLDQSPDVLVVGSAVMTIDEDGDPFGVSSYPEGHVEIERSILAGTGGIIHPSVMIRGDALRAIGGYATDLPIAEDQDLWLRLACHGRLVNLPDVLLKYRVHSANMSFVGMTDAARTLHQILQSHRQRRGLPEILSAAEVIPVSGWDRRRMWAWTAIQDGHQRTARKHAWQLIRQKPWHPNGWKLAAAATFPKRFDQLHRIVSGVGPK